MKYAGFWKRVAACWIDCIVVTLVICGVAIVTNPLFPEGFEGRNDPRAIVIQVTIIVAVLLGLPVLYAALFESSKHQATLGKILLRLSVVDTNGSRLSFARSFARNAPKVINLLIPPLYFLFFAIPMSKKKQALHDKCAGTFVIESTTGEHTTTGCSPISNRASAI